MTCTDWDTVIRPRVRGTWNIHQVLSRTQHMTEFFVLFSSILGISCQPGQANYAAANTFLDAFSQYCTRQGRPCQTVDIGAVDGVGYLARDTRARDRFRATAVHLLTEQDILDTVQFAIQRCAASSTRRREGASLQHERLGQWEYQSHTQIAIGLRSTMPIKSEQSRVSWRSDPRMALYHNIEDCQEVSSQSSGKDELKEFLNTIAYSPEFLDTADVPAFLAQQIGKTLFSFLLRHPDEVPDIDQSPSSIGMDSLVAIEIRNWISRRLQLSLKVQEIIGISSLRQLGANIRDKMKETSRIVLDI